MAKTSFKHIRLSRRATNESFFLVPLLTLMVCRTISGAPRRCSLACWYSSFCFIISFSWGTLETQFFCVCLKSLKLNPVGKHFMFLFFKTNQNSSLQNFPPLGLDDPHRRRPPCDSSESQNIKRSPRMGCKSHHRINVQKYKYCTYFNIFKVPTLAMMSV